MRHDIAILGDGPTGLTMALALADKGIDCALIGPQTAAAAKADGRTTAIMQDGIRFLENLGLWPALQGHAAPLEKMHLLSGDRDIVFASSEIGLPQFGFNIPNSLLKLALQDKVRKAKRITTIAATAQDVVFPVTGTAGPVSISCDKKQTVEAHLLIGADGGNSLARRAAEIDTMTVDANQSALVCLVKADDTHCWTSTEWYYSGGPFTLVPTADPHVMAVVYCDTPEIVADAQAASLDDLSEQLTGLSNGHFGELQVISAVQSWPIRPLRATQLVANHLALVGEAAHVMPPLAAQGFNISLRDIQCLQHILAQAHNLGLDKAHMSVLDPYARQRRADITLRGQAVNGLNKMIRRDDPLGRRLHGFGFATLDKVMPLKKALMRVALAPKQEIRA